MRVEKLLFIATVAILLVGCGGSDLKEPVSVAPVDGELIADFPANLLKASMVKDKKIDANKTVFGYRAYKIPYTTTGENGEKVKVTGVMVVPTSYNAEPKAKESIEKIEKIGFSIVLDAHGTIFKNEEAPSVKIYNTSTPSGSSVIYSSLSGFITLQPDYIGFGDSKDMPHPYLLKKSSSSAMVDFVDAAFKFAKSNNIPIIETKDIYLSGYSQGGYVAMASLKDLEQKYNVKMATPMAGPYFLDLIAQGVVEEDNVSAPSFMAAVAHSYSNRYSIDIKDLINEPYASKLPKLFDSKAYTREEIDKELTTKSKGDDGLFSDKLVANLPESEFIKKLKENSVINFKPKTKVRLIHCMGDDIIPFELSFAAKETLKEQFNAEDVNIVPVEIAVKNNPFTTFRLGHADCAAYAYGVSAYLFSEVRGY